MTFIGKFDPEICEVEVLKEATVSDGSTIFRIGNDIFLTEKLYGASIPLMKWTDNGYKLIRRYALYDYEKKIGDPGRGTYDKETIAMIKDARVFAKRFAQDCYRI